MRHRPSHAVWSAVIGILTLVGGCRGLVKQNADVENSRTTFLQGGECGHPPAEENQSEVPVCTDTADETHPLPTGVDTPAASTPVPGPAAFGIAGIRGFPYGDVMASNGVEFTPIFTLDFNFNLWLWRQQRLYLFSDSRFWGQKAAPGITNPTQGPFDFSKRELDLTIGTAWNYYGSWEARFFAYSFSNLNRGTSNISPSGFNDGVGVENRYYLSQTYAALGTTDFDIARATFLSAGYYPSKSMITNTGQQFTPGAFARAYLTWNVFGPRYYVFTDDQIILDRNWQGTLLRTDSGIAVRPFDHISRLEFRVGSEDTFDLQGGRDFETSAYVAVRYVY